jgi:hypothetical protein
VLAAFVLLFLLGAAAASRLQMRLDYLELLPEDDPAVRDLHWVMRKAGSEGHLITGIRGGTREQRLAFAERWTALLAARSEFRYAEYRYDVAFYRTHAASLLPLDALEEVAAKLDRMVHESVEELIGADLDDDPASEEPTPAEELERIVADYERRLPPEHLEDKAREEVFVLAKPAAESTDMGQVERLLGALREEADRLLAAPEHRGLEADFGGPMVLQRAFDRGIRGDLGRISAASFLLATLFLVAATRRPLAALLIVAPVAIALSVTLGLAAVAIGHLTIISGTLVAILLGLGVEFGLHLVLRAQEARSLQGLEAALLEAVPDTMRGAFSGALTNAAAYAVLIGCGFRAFREFGAIAAAGVLLSWLFS